MMSENHAGGCLSAEHDEAAKQHDSEI